VFSKITIVFFFFFLINKTGEYPITYGYIKSIETIFLDTKNIGLGNYSWMDCLVDPAEKLKKSLFAIAATLTDGTRTGWLNGDDGFARLNFDDVKYSDDKQ